MATVLSASPKAHSCGKLLQNANCKYLGNNICDINREVYFLGDLNVDWLSSNCPLRKKLQTVTSACNLGQVVSQPTMVVTNSTGIKSSTCIDHIFTNAADICFKAVSKSIGCSDHMVERDEAKGMAIKSGRQLIGKHTAN